MSLHPLYVFLGEVTVQVFCPFFNWVACLLREDSHEFLYILEIKPLSEVSLAIMFSHMVGSLFILMLFSLAMQKLFILMKSHLLILSFMSLALRHILVKILLHGIYEIFLLMFSWRTFIVSHLIFKSFIHLEFIVVHGVSWWSTFIFLHVSVQLSQHHLLKRVYLFHFILLPPLSNSNWP